MFSRALPEFLAIGMTVEQFYDGPCRLAVAFKKAHVIRREQANFDAYLQGYYVYEAMLRTSPVVHDFAKDSKPVEYLEKPVEIGYRKDAGDPSGNIDEGKPAKGETAGAAWMQAFMTSHNAKRRAKMGDTEPAMDEKETI